MCEPTTIIAGTALALQAYSAYSSSQAANEAGQSQQNYYNYLADNNDKQAKDTEAQGVQIATVTQDQAARDTKTLRNEVHKVEGTQKATMAANGVGLDSATAEDIAGDTFDRAKMDELAVRYNADMRSWDAQETAKQNAYQLRVQARGYRMGGANAATAGRVAATTSLLGGATSMAGTTFNWSQTSAGKKLTGWG